MLFLVGLGVMTAVILWSYYYEWSVTRSAPPAGIFIDTPQGARLHTITYEPKAACSAAAGEAAAADMPADGLLPIIAIHGSTTNALDYNVDLGPQLAQGRVVTAPDRLGHGFSDRRRPDGYRLDVQAEAIRDVADHYGWEKPIILGQSFGGAVALRYAMDFPDRLAGLVLVAPVSHSWRGGVAWYNRVGINPIYGWFFRRTFIPLYGRFGSQNGAAAALRDSPKVNQYHTLSRVPLTFRPTKFGYNAEDIVRLYAQLHAMERRYGEITVPTEIVSGSHDMSVITSMHSGGLEREMPNANLTVVERGGHALHHSHPQAVLDALARLDTRLASANTSPLQGALRRLGAVFPRARS